MGLDLSILLPMIAGLTKNKHLSKAAEIYKENKPAFDLAFKIIKDKIDKDDDDKFVLPTIEPEVDEGPVYVPPSAPAIPVVDPESQVVSGLRLSAWIEEKGKIWPKPEYEAALAGSNALNGNGHTKVHMDIDPLDQHGNEIRPGDPDLAQLLGADGKPLMQYHWTWDGDSGGGPITIHQWHRSHGCTPVPKIHELDDNDVDHELVLWASFNGIESNRLKFRVRK